MTIAVIGVIFMIIACICAAVSCAKQELKEWARFKEDTELLLAQQRVQITSCILFGYCKKLLLDTEQSHVDKNEVIVLIKDALIVLGSDSLRADKFGNDKFGNGESG